MPTRLSLSCVFTPPALWGQVYKQHWWNDDDEEDMVLEDLD